MKGLLFFLRVTLFGLFALYFTIMFNNAFLSITVVSISFLFYFFLDLLLIKITSCTLLARYFFLLGFTLLCFFAFTDYAVSISKGSADEPFLVGDATGKFGYHSLALGVANSETWNEMLNVAYITNQVGYPLILGLIYKYVYCDLITAFFLSFFTGLFIIYLTGLTFSKLNQSKKGFAYTILFAAISPQILSCGIYILKDVYIILAVLILVISIEYLKSNKLIKSITLFGLGFGIVMLFRSQLLLFVILLLLVNIKVLKGKLIYLSIALAFFLVYFLGSGIEFKYFSLDVGYFTNLIVENGVGNEWTDSGGGVTDFLGKATLSMPLPLRLLCIPLTMSIQYFLPFNIWKFDHPYPFYYVFINLNVIWWFVIGPYVIYSLIKLKKHATQSNKNTFLLGFIMFAVMAFIYAGVVPRYFYPFMPLLIMSAGSLIGEMSLDFALMKHFKVFQKKYFTSLIIAVLFYVIISLVVTI